MDATNILSDCRIVPVVVLHDSKSAIPLAHTLYAAGIKAIEITLRTTVALEAIGLIAKEVPDILIGAGSVRNVTQFGEATDQGAQFVVSPGSSAPLITTAQKTRMPFIPGATSPTEIINLIENGYLLQKFFPAEQCGGIAMLKALSAPLPEVSFFPTGGITAKLMPDYLQLECVSCVGGSWFVSPAMLHENDFQQIGELAEIAARLADD